MTRKVDKGHSSEFDRFDRKQKKRQSIRGNHSKRKLSIYDEFGEEESEDFFPDQQYDGNDEMD